MKRLERTFITLIIILFLPCTTLSQTSFYRVISGNIALSSDAPLELINASSNSVKAIIDPEQRSFKFSTSVTSFKGFNSALQRQHFNSNYMESSHFPEAKFSGKIIDDINLMEEGSYTIRAKGQLEIHGVSRERIIKSTLRVKQGRLYIQSDFSVLLEDHNITIPKIVNQKIAEEIKIRINAELAQS